MKFIIYFKKRNNYNLTFSSYDCPSMISGAWYPGVPTRPTVPPDEQNLDIP
jgi:hypothetical protein